jgi:hypothetical protein
MEKHLMIKITAYMKRFKTDDPTWSSLRVFALYVDGHAKSKHLCNIASAITLYGKEAIRFKQDFEIQEQKGEVSIRLHDDATPTDDLETLRVITYQLLLFAQQHPKEVSFQYAIPNPDTAQYNYVSILPNGSTTSGKNREQEKPVKKENQ